VQVERDELELVRVIEALTAGPARAFGIDRWVPGAGTLTPGLAGDIVVFDPAQRWTVEPTRFASKGKNTPLAGTELRGEVRAVVIRGEVAHVMEAAHV
jgi:dihydroorotase